MNALRNPMNNPLFKAIGVAINATNYLGNNGAIQQAKRLSKIHLSNEKNTELQIISAQMNAYYSAAVFFQSQSVFYYPFVVWFLYQAEKLVRKCAALSWYIKGVSPDILQQCQAIYCAVAVMKDKLFLSPIDERHQVYHLHQLIQKSEGDSLVKALSSATFMKLPNAKECLLWGEAKQMVEDEIKRLEDQSCNRLTVREAQVLCQLLRVMGENEKASDVALSYGLTDQKIKADRGF